MMRAAPKLLATTALSAMIATPALAQGVSQDRAVQSLEWVLPGWDVGIDSVEVGEVTGDVAYTGIRATRGEDVLAIGRLDIDGAVYDGAWMVGWDGMRLAGLRAQGEDDMAVTIDRIVLDSPGLNWARPLQQIRDFGEIEDPQVALDFVWDMRVDSFLIEGLSVSGDDADVRLDRIAYDDLRDGILTSFTMDGLSVMDDEADVVIDRLAMSNFRVGALLRAALAEEMAVATEQEITDLVSPSDLIDAVMIVDSFVLDGLSVAVKDIADPITMASLRVNLTNRVDGVPTNAETSMEDLIVPVSVMEDPMARNTFTELGISELAIGLTANSTYDPNTMTVIGDETITVRDVGALGLSITLTNFDPEQIAAVALTEMSGDSLDMPDMAIAQFGLRIADENFIPRVLELTAPMTGQDPQATIAMAQSGITMLALMEPSLSSVATELSSAVGNLLRSSGTIALAIDFNPPFAFSEIEEGDFEGPEDVLSRMDISVTYEAP